MLIYEIPGLNNQIDFVTAYFNRLSQGYAAGMKLPFLSILTGYNPIVMVNQII